MAAADRADLPHAHMAEDDDPERAQDSRGKPPNQRPSEPQARRDGELNPEDTARDGDPSFVNSGVSDGGQEGKYGEDEYKDRRNEQTKKDNPQG